MIVPFRTLLLATLCTAGLSACSPEPRGAASNAPAPEQRVTPQAPPPAADPPGPVVTFSAPPRAYTGPLPPLPQVSYPLPRSPEVVQAVYTFAARHPEVLHYVPCFCGCQRSGHSDNDDCFIKGRDAQGRPEWEAHGMG